MALRKIWRDGDTITVSLPMESTQESPPGDNSVAAALYGRLVLAADLGVGPPDGPMRAVPGRATEPNNLPAADPLPKIAAHLESALELRFVSDGPGVNPFIPIY